MLYIINNDIHQVCLCDKMISQQFQTVLKLRPKQLCQCEYFKFSSFKFTMTKYCMHKHTDTHMYACMKNWPTDIVTSICLVLYKCMKKYMKRRREKSFHIIIILITDFNYYILIITFRNL